MARIAGVDLPRDKRVEVGLTYIFGIGSSLARDTVAAARIDPATRLRDLSDDEIVRLRDFIDAKYKVEGELRRQVSQVIKRKVKINCYWGVRQLRVLLVRVQR